MEDEGLKKPGRRLLVGPAFLAPETRHVGDLMRDMRESGSQMAILLDEYGGTSGLVTLRQLADELVGRALVKATGGAPFFRLVEGRLRLLGEARVRDVNRELGLELVLLADGNAKHQIVEHARIPVFFREPPFGRIACQLNGILIGHAALPTGKGG